MTEMNFLGDEKEFSPRGWHIEEDNKESEKGRLNVGNYIQDVLKDVRSGGGGDVLLQGQDGGVHCHALLLAIISPLMSRLLEEHQDEDLDKLVIVFTETKKAQLEDLVDIAHSGVAIMRDKNTMGLLSRVEINYTLDPVRKALMDETENQLKEKKLLQCDICGDSVTSMPLLKKHIWSSHCDEDWNHFKNNFQTLKCDDCEHTFFTKTALRNHGRKVHKDFKTPLLPNGKHTQRKPATAIEKRTCKECGKVCPSVRALEDHLLVHTHGVQPFQCGDCGQKSNSRKGLRAHRMQHTVLDVPLLCNKCGKTLNSEWEMKEHKKEHLNESRYSCRLCGECFPDKTAFRDHQNSSHKPKKKYLACSSCSHR